jgi:hypothetical protein
MSISAVKFNNELCRALALLAASPRFELFKGIEIGRLIPEQFQGDSELSALTLESLVGRISAIEDGSYQISEQRQGILLELLNALIDDGDGVISTATPPQMIPDDTELREVDDLAQEQQALSSVGLELALREHINRVKSHASYDRVRSMTVGDFWEPSWTPAPFEEAFTIEQLARIDLAQLFKKRSVSDSRIHNIVRALKKVEDALAADNKDDARRQSSKPTVTQTSSDSAAGAEQGSYVPVPRHVRGAARVALYELLLRPAGDPLEVQAERARLALVSRLGVSACVELVLREKSGRADIEALRQVITECFEPYRLGLAKAVLSGAGVGEYEIACALLLGAPEARSIERSPCAGHIGALAQVIGALVAVSLGAQVVRYRGSECEGMWTLNPDLLEMIYNSPGRKTLDPFLLKFIQSRARGAKTAKVKAKRATRR